MKMLIAEDNNDTAILYKRALEERSHKVIVTNNGQCCLEIYHEELQNIASNTDPSEHIQTFELVVLDYKCQKSTIWKLQKKFELLIPIRR